MADRLQQALSVSATLLRGRDAARRLFGVEYDKRVQPWRELVRALAKTHECSALEAPLILERDRAMPPNPLLLFAAVVEEVDASNAEESSRA